MDASDIRGMDDLDNLIEAARCLGLVQARKAFGQYGPDDAASESGLHASISKRATRLRAEVEALKSEDAGLRKTWQKENDELVQILGKALRYPRFVDDQSVFPGATESDGVCVPCHTAMSIADEAAKKIEALRAEVEQWRKASAKLIEHDRNLCDRIDPLYDERDSLKAEVEALRADAERYRWLVSVAYQSADARGPTFQMTVRRTDWASIENAIDAAIKSGLK